MTPAQKHEDPEPKGYSQGYEYFGMALNFTIAILLFGAGGWFLDGWVHTRPLFAIIGAFVGGFAGFMSIDRKSTRLNSSHSSISYAVFCLKKNTSDETPPSRSILRRSTDEDSMC